MFLKEKNFSKQEATVSERFDIAGKNIGVGDIVEFDYVDLDRIAAGLESETQILEGVVEKVLPKGGPDGKGIVIVRTKENGVEWVESARLGNVIFENKGENKQEEKKEKGFFEIFHDENEELSVENIRQEIEREEAEEKVEIQEGEEAILEVSEGGSQEDPFDEDVEQGREEFLGEEEPFEVSEEQEEAFEEELIPKETWIYNEQGIPESVILPEHLKYASEEDWEALVRNNKYNFFVNGIGLGDYVAHSKENRSSSFEMIPLDKIVSTVSPVFENWNHEYGGRIGRKKEILSDFQYDPKKATERVFHPNEPTEQIKVLVIHGPAGDLYIVKDGSHRIGASKLMGFQEVPVQVIESEVPKRVSTVDSGTKFAWETAIKAGLIKGNIEESQDEERSLYTLQIEESVLPWATLSFVDFTAINEYYEKLHPGVFDNIMNLNTGEVIPKDVFIRPLGLYDYVRSLKQ